jgi:hypothetical protein
MNKIKIFMHLNDMPGSHALMSEQLSRLSETGLLDQANRVFLCTNGKEENFLKAMEVMSVYGQVRFIHTANRTDFWEFPSLDLLKRNCDADGDEEFNVFYFHLKGLSRLNDQNVIDWRKFMEYHMIDRWEECVEKLESGYDLVGTNIIEKPWLHTSGNFWWSKSSYIKKLDPLISPDKYQWGTPSKYTGAVLDGGNFRYDHEAWIGSANPTFFEIASTPGKEEPGWHFKNPYPEELYVQTSTTA